MRFWRLRFSSDADIVRLTNARIIIIIIADQNTKATAYWSDSSAKCYLNQ